MAGMMRQGRPPDRGGSSKPDGVTAALAAGACLGARPLPRCAGEGGAREDQSREPSLGPVPSRRAPRALRVVQRSPRPPTKRGNPCWAGGRAGVRPPLRPGQRAPVSARRYLMPPGSPGGLQDAQGHAGCRDAWLPSRPPYRITSWLVRHSLPGPRIGRVGGRGACRWEILRPLVRPISRPPLPESSALFSPPEGAGTSFLSSCRSARYPHDTMARMKRDRRVYEVIPVHTTSLARPRWMGHGQQATRRCPLRRTGRGRSFVQRHDPVTRWSSALLGKR